MLAGAFQPRELGISWHSVELPLHRGHGVEFWVYRGEGVFDALFDIVFGQLSSEGNCDIKDEVDAGGTVDDAKIMDVELGIYRADYAQRHLAISVDDRIVDRYRIDVNKHDDLGVCGKVALDLVGKFVPVVDGHAAVHLDVNARVKFFTVTVYVEVVQTYHALIAHHPVLDALDDLLVGRLAEQAAERGAKYTYARDGDQDRDDKPHHPVKVDGRKVRYDQRDYDRKRRRRVAYAVRRGRLERGRRDLFGKQSIEEEHPQLDQHRHGKNDDRRDRKFALLGRYQLADRLDRQLDRNDEHGRSSPRYIPFFGARTDALCPQAFRRP